MAPAQLPHMAVPAEELARRLNEVVVAIDQARSVGLAVDVPEPLYRACAEIVARYNRSGPPGGSEACSSSQWALRSGVAETVASSDEEPLDRLSAREHASVRDVPLRRLLWQVLDPGEEFTVNEVVQRLAAIGMHPSANAVSNALGYWVSRNRLNRQRKGVYLYPEIADRAGHSHKGDASQEIPAGDRATARRKETRNESVQESTRQAM